MTFLFHSFILFPYLDRIEWKAFREMQITSDFSFEIRTTDAFLVYQGEIEVRCPFLTIHLFSVQFFLSQFLEILGELPPVIIFEILFLRAKDIRILDLLFIISRNRFFITTWTPFLFPSPLSIWEAQIMNFQFCHRSNWILKFWLTSFFRFRPEFYAL